MCFIVNLNLRMHFDFKEKSNSIVIDVSGNGLNGLLMNGATISNGVLYLNGGVSQNRDPYVNLNPNSLTDLYVFSISFWVKTHASVEWARVFEFYTPDNFLNSMVFVAISNLGPQPFFQYTLYGTPYTFDTRVIVPPDTWAHFVVVVNSYQITIYFNSTQILDQTVTKSLSDLGNTTFKWLGRSDDVNNRGLNGYLDDFRIYTRAISAEEATVLFNNKL